MENKGKKYKVIKRSNSAVLLETITGEKRWKIRDVENEDIAFCLTEESALETFNTYDIECVRSERKRMFENWVKTFCIEDEAQLKLNFD